MVNQKKIEEYRKQLKPCPLCGGKTDIFYGYTYYIECMKCDLVLNRAKLFPLVKAWNKRVEVKDEAQEKP